MSVEIYTIGLVYCSVCAQKDMPREEIVVEVNARTPTGISSQWRISSNPTFLTGQPHPCECDQNPDRLHWLLEC